MRTKARTALAAITFALLALAQTSAVARPVGETQKLWKIEASGIAG